MLSALNGSVRADDRNARWLRDYVQATRVYWNDKGPVPGYDVSPGPKSVDRYYDDNAWMVLALVEASDILHDKKIFGYAEDTLKYVLSGEDSNLGGGIYWREAEKTSKNTCSNGPSAAACLAVYEKTKEPRLLQKAIQIYDWTKQNLQDPSDFLYWDAMTMNGKIGKDKWSYNTALMLRTAAELFRYTHEARYAKEATDLFTASWNHWIDPKTFAFKDEGKFAHLLFEALTIYRKDLETTSPSDSQLQSIVEHLHGLRDPASGLYPSRWDAAKPSKGPKWELIDQASAARAYFIFASINRK